MSAGVTPEAEVDVDLQTVRALLQAQHPDLAEEPLRKAPSGWDNFNFRLGDTLAVRLPRRAVAATCILNEQRWLPELAPRLPLALPLPERIGAPGPGMPWAWSIVRWQPGEAADFEPPEASAAAVALGRFLAALHQPAAPDAPRNEARGVPLRERNEAFEGRLAQLGQALDVPRARQVWQAGLAAPEHAGPPVWLHGDLHPANLITQDGQLTAVIDFGDLCGGDPAADVAGAWMLLPEAAHEDFRAAMGGCDEALWLRARACALAVAAAVLASSSDNPRMRRLGDAMLTRALAPSLP